MFYRLSHETVLFSDDPYYCGLRARIPNFAKSRAQKEKEREKQERGESKYAGVGAMRDIGGPGGHHLVWGGPQRGYMDNGESTEVTRGHCHAALFVPPEHLEQFTIFLQYPQFLALQHGPSSHSAVHRPC